MDFPYIDKKYYAYICRPTPFLIFCPNGTADTLLLIS
jgi:hypothetical protein